MLKILILGFSENSKTSKVFQSEETDEIKKQKVGLPPSVKSILFASIKAL